METLYLCSLIQNNMKKVVKEIKPNLEVIKSRTKSLQERVKILSALLENSN